MNQGTLASAPAPSLVHFFVVFAAVELEAASLALKKSVAVFDTAAAEQLAILRIVEHIQSIFPAHLSEKDIAALFMLLFLFETFPRNIVLKAIFEAQNRCCLQHWLG